MKRVLFVCVGNCCRSQMAEGFANSYGSDVLVASSAGLAPTIHVVRDTVDTMREKNIDISHHFPKKFDPTRAAADLIVNMSGLPLPPGAGAEVVEWQVEDPFGKSPAVYQRSCQDIENKVMALILQLRRNGKRSGV